MLRDLNYLNIAEIKSFCKQHSIPYKIAFETKDGTRRTTKDEDRKGVMLRRVRHFLQTWGFRRLVIGVPGDRDRDSGMMVITIPG